MVPLARVRVGHPPFNVGTDLFVDRLIAGARHVLKPTHRKGSVFPQDRLHHAAVFLQPASFADQGDPIGVIPRRIRLIQRLAARFAVCARLRTDPPESDPFADIESRFRTRTLQSELRIHCADH